MKADNIRLRGAASNGEDSAETDTLMNNMENNTDNNNNSNNTSAPLTVKIDSATDSSSSSSSSSASNNEANSNNNTISSPSANANGNIHPLAAALGMTSLGVSTKIFKEKIVFYVIFFFREGNFWCGKVSTCWLPKVPNSYEHIYRDKLEDTSI